MGLACGGAGSNSGEAFEVQARRAIVVGEADMKRRKQENVSGKEQGTLLSFLIKGP